MRLPHERDDGGQALAVAAAAAFLLAAALTITIDWGYALMQRGIVQNEADKVALEVGRYLATSVMPSSSSVRFRVRDGNGTRNLSHIDACSKANDALMRDRRPTPAPVSPVTPLVRLWLTFEEWDSPDQTGTSRLARADTVECARTRTGSSVNRQATSVRARVEIRYKSLVGSLLREPEMRVAATARAALAGAPYTADPLLARDGLSGPEYADLARSATALIRDDLAARTWPLARRFSRSELQDKQPCGPLCKPTSASQRLQFATGASSGVRLLDLSAHSSRLPAGAGGPVEQLITEWDGSCEQSAQCSLANWFDQPFAGALGLDTIWDEDRPAGQGELPALDPDRGACDSVPGWMPEPPSCRDENDGNNRRGDWVETVDGSIGADLTLRMRQLIAREGSTVPHSANTVGGSGPNKNNFFGKALVVWIYLWDCGQDFSGGRFDDQCHSDNAERIDRVHLFSVVPFTFYEGSVSSSAVEGYWGGGFVDPGRCQAGPGSCPSLTPVANTAFLVPDDHAWDPTEYGQLDDEEFEDDPVDPVVP